MRISTGSSLALLLPVQRASLSPIQPAPAARAPALVYTCFCSGYQAGLFLAAELFAARYRRLPLGNGRAQRRGNAPMPGSHLHLGRWLLGAAGFFVASSNGAGQPLALLVALLISATVSAAPVRFAICGVGHIGRRHAALVARHAGASLVALIDVRAELRPSLAAEFPGVPFFLSLEDYLQSGPAADVLTVATPNGLHAAQAVAGLRAGRHVVIEKPIALRTTDADAIVRTAAQTGRLAFGVMQNRYSPPAAWLRQVVEEGRLGEVFLVQLNCFWNRDARYYQPGGWRGTQALDGGTLFTQFSHFVDLLYWVFGDITNIAARFRDFNHQGITEFEDSGLVTFDLVRGGSGTLSYSTAVWDRNLESSLTVVAARGALKLGGQYLDKVEYCHLQDYEMPALPPTSPANDYGPYQGSAANHVQVIDNVVDTLQNRSHATTNAREGRKVVEIIERIYALR